MDAPQGPSTLVPTAGHGRDSRVSVNTGSLGSCITCRKCKGPGGHCAEGHAPAPAYVTLHLGGCGWTSCPRLHPVDRALKASPMLNWEWKSIFRISEGPGQTHIHALPRLRPPSQSLSVALGPQLWSRPPARPCPLTLALSRLWPWVRDRTTSHAPPLWGFQNTPGAPMQVR